MKTADKLFDGSNAHLLESPVDSLLMPVSGGYGSVKSELILILAAAMVDAHIICHWVNKEETPYVFENRR